MQHKESTSTPSSGVIKLTGGFVTKMTDNSVAPSIGVVALVIFTVPTRVTEVRTSGNLAIIFD